MKSEKRPYRRIGENILFIDFESRSKKIVAVNDNDEHSNKPITFYYNHLMAFRIEGHQMIFETPFIERLRNFE